MSTTIALKCVCGTMRGLASDVSAKTGIRLVCMCDDCQTYAHFLARPKELLDAHGGTDIFQLTPGQVRITQGSDQLRCVRLSYIRRWQRWASASG